MDLVFQSLLDEALSEISRRNPTYFSRFPLMIPEVVDQVARYADLPLFQNYNKAEIAGALTAGIGYITGQGGTNGVVGSPPDPVAALLLDSIMDAFATTGSDLQLAPAPKPPRSFAKLLAEDYDERVTKDGRRYIVRRKGDRPVLLISACGVPLTVWTRFLGDPDHNFRIIAVESRSGDMIAGGMDSESDLTTDVGDIEGVLDEMALTTIEVMAWCDGGRPALALARRRPDQVRSLVLVSINLRGTEGVEDRPTPFEANLGKVFSSMAARPALAPLFAKMLGEQALAVDWDGLAEDPAERAAALFRLPAAEHAGAIRVPMSQSTYLLNYGRRAVRDVAHPVRDDLGRLEQPILWISGDHDQIANNTVTGAVLGKFTRNTIHADIKGAGHYLYDLQYSYFRLLLKEFLVYRRLPTATARVHVQTL